MLETQVNAGPVARRGWRRPWFIPAAAILLIGTAFIFIRLFPGLGGPAIQGRIASDGKGFAGRALARRAFASAPVQEARSAAEPLPGEARKVISTAKLEIKVRSAPAAADTLARMAVAAGGFVQSSNTYIPEDRSREPGVGRYAELVLRIPAGRFQRFLAAAGNLGRIVRKEISGVDVTEDYIDLQARLRNWEHQERQLIAIMARAKTVGEVLAVQEELGRVRETIEEIQGKIKYYDHHVALATVNVTLREGAARPAGRPWFLEELAALGRAFYGSIRILLLAVLALIPWLLAALGVYAFARRHGRRGAGS
ncbi:MAG: DUF4349 domain-containing protein [Patescibacteria group bacterium]